MITNHMASIVERYIIKISLATIKGKSVSDAPYDGYRKQLANSGLVSQVTSLVFQLTSSGVD